MTACPYCGGDTAPRYSGLHHPIWKEMNSIDMQVCTKCAGMTTDPMPSPELLALCYGKYTTIGIPEAKAQAKAGTNQNQWYEDVIAIFGAQSLDGARVADIAAGEGFLAQKLVAHGASRVDGFDFHPRPAILASEGERIRWVQTDLSADAWPCEGNYDWVFCIAFIEHVTDPRRLVENACRIARPGGNVCVIGPCVDALACRAMGLRWPYMIPGEHLTLPSIDGLREMCRHLPGTITELKMIPVSYSVNYALGALFGVTLPAALDMVLRVPVGAFALKLQTKTV